MADDGKKTYRLRLELRGEDGETVGEVSAQFSGSALRGLIEQALAPEDVRGSDTSARPRPEPFRGRGDAPTRARGDGRSMSTEQRRLLFRLAYSLGFKRSDAAQKVLETLGVERFEDATRSSASIGIDMLRAELARRDERPSNGAGSHG